MKTLEKKVKEVLLNTAKRDANRKEGYYNLYCIENELYDLNVEKIEQYVNEQIKMGFTIDDLKFRQQYNIEDFLTVQNELNNTYVSARCCEIYRKPSLTKKQLVESLQQYNEIVIKRSEEILNNRKVAEQFITEKKFLQNNLDAMMINKEAHDYILQIKDEMQKESEAKKLEFQNWALQNCSELVKLRIENNQNWQRLAAIEYAKKQLPGYHEFDELVNCEVIESWAVKNSDIEQLKILAETKKLYPEIDFEVWRFKFDNGEEYEHADFINANVKTPSGEVDLYAEL